MRYSYYKSDSKLYSMQLTESKSTISCKTRITKANRDFNIIFDEKNYIYDIYYKNHYLKLQRKDKSINLIDKNSTEILFSKVLQHKGGSKGRYRKNLGLKYMKCIRYCMN